MDRITTLSQAIIQASPNAIIADENQKGNGKIMKISRKNKDLIVRAIEDAIIMFLLFAAVWSLAFVASGVLKILGVA